MTRRKIDDEVLQLFAVFGGHAPRLVVAFDPSSTSTGWAILRADKLGTYVVASGQGRPERVVVDVDTALGEEDTIPLLLIEKPFQRRPRHKRVNGAFVVGDDGEQEIAAEGNQQAVAEAAGFLRGAFCRDVDVDEGVTWRPTPAQWRAVIGLNKGPAGTAKRDDVNLGVWLWSRATTGRPLCHPHPTKPGEVIRHVDEANAIALAYAGIAVATARRVR